MILIDDWKKVAEGLEEFPDNHFYNLFGSSFDHDCECAFLESINSFEKFAEFEVRFKKILHGYSVKVSEADSLVDCSERYFSSLQNFLRDFGMSDDASFIGNLSHKFFNGDPSKLERSEKFDMIFSSIESEVLHEYDSLSPIDTLTYPLYEALLGIANSSLIRALSNGASL